MRTQRVEQINGSSLLDQLAASQNARKALERMSMRPNLRIAADASLQRTAEEPQSELTPGQFARVSLRHPDICDRIVALHAAGHGRADIESRVSMYAGESIPASFVDATLANLRSEATDWRRRPLESSYPIVIFERVRMKCREGAGAQNRNCHIAIGFQAHGPKEVLGFWFESGDETAFLRQVLRDLQDRGVEDVIYILGSSAALRAAQEEMFPDATVIAHVGDFVRQSQDLATCNDRGAIAKALRHVHGARTDAEALANLAAFEASALARKSPSIGPLWRRHWAELLPFFAIAPELRCVMTSTFAADGLRRGLKKALRCRKSSVSLDEAATLVYLAAWDVHRRWKRPQREWHAAKTQLALRFPDRFC
jgi:putative transposase